MKQIPLPVGLKPQPRLSDFFVGKNTQAFEPIVHLSQGHALPESILLLWAQGACGKTFLLKGLAEALKEQGIPVGFVDASSVLPLFQYEWQGLILDDVDQYDANRQAWVFQSLIAAFQSADGQKRWVVASAQTPPADWGAYREDVRSRLSMGLIFELQALDDNERLAILQLQAKARGLSLSDDVFRYILTRFSRDISSLIQLLEALDHYALQSKRAITLPLLREMFEQADPFEDVEDTQ